MTRLYHPWAYTCRALSYNSDAHTSVFRTGLVTITKKESASPANKWTMKTQYIYSPGSSSSLKEEEIIKSPGKWIE